MSTHEMEKLFEEYVDEVYGMVRVAGFDYSTHDILKATDPIAWRQLFLDWSDSEGWDKKDGTGVKHDR